MLANKCQHALHRLGRVDFAGIYLKARAVRFATAIKRQAASATDVSKMDQYGGVAVEHVSLGPLRIARVGQLDYRKMRGDAAVFRFAVRGTPTTAIDLPIERGLQRAAVDASLPAGNDFDQFSVLLVQPFSPYAIS